MTIGLSAFFSSPCLCGLANEVLSLSDGGHEFQAEGLKDTPLTIE